MHSDTATTRIGSPSDFTTPLQHTRIRFECDSHTRPPRVRSDLTRIREQSSASRILRSPSHPTAHRRRSIAGSSSSPTTPTLALMRTMKRGRINFAATSSAPTEGTTTWRFISPSATWRTPTTATPGTGVHRSDCASSTPTSSLTTTTKTSSLRHRPTLSRYSRCSRVSRRPLRL